LIVIGRGRLIATTTVGDILRGGSTLEDAYLALTRDAVDHHAGASAP
jgi:hypothetical protein